jgi:hypothetical protein
MNRLLLKKIKKALDSTRPLETIREIVSEFEEIERLVKWREEILLNARNIEKHREELKKIDELMLKYQYPYDIHKDSVDALIKKYLKQYK